MRTKKCPKRANIARINFVAVRPLRGRLVYALFATAGSGRFAPFTSGYGYSPSSRTACGYKRSKHERSKALRVLFFLTDLVGHSRHCHLEEKADKVLIGAFGAYRAQGGYIFLAA